MSVMSLVGEIKIQGKDEALSSLKSVDQAAEHTAGGFKSMLTNALSFASGQAVFTGVGDAIGFLKNQLTDTIKVAMDHQQIEAQTVQVLKSTRDASGETAGAVSDLADKYSTLTEFSAGTTQAAENMLLTFTNIGKDVFPQATKTVLDMSQALGQDTKSSAIQLGKALGEPLTGMTALQRVGVTFSATQKDLIKGYIAHGETAKAQGVILQELQKEFGGSAEAAGKTAAGGMAILSHQFEDMKVKIGTALLPILKEFETWFVQNGMPVLQNFGNWFITQGIPALQNLWTQINTNVLPTLQQLGQWLLQNGVPLLQQMGTVIGTMVLPVLGDLVTGASQLVSWFAQGGPQTTILKDALIGIGLAIAGVKVIGFTNDLLGMGKAALDFATNSGPKLVELLTGQKGISGAADTASGSLKDIGTTAKTTMAKDVGEGATTAEGEIGGIGKAATTTEGVVKTEAGAMATDLSTNVGAGAKEADAAEVSIGTTATTTEGVVSTAATGMLSALAPVALSIVGIQQAMQGWSGVQSAWANFQKGDKNPNDYISATDQNDPLAANLQRFFLWITGKNQTNSTKVQTGPNSWGDKLPQPTHFPAPIHRAAGGFVGANELTLVGENGPELAQFPAGTNILPNSVTNAAMGSGRPLQVNVQVFLDGELLPGYLMPRIVQEIRTKTGINF